MRGNSSQYGGKRGVRDNVSPFGTETATAEIIYVCFCVFAMPPFCFAFVANNDHL